MWDVVDFGVQVDVGGLMGGNRDEKGVDSPEKAGWCLMAGVKDGVSVWGVIVWVGHSCEGVKNPLEFLWVKEVQDKYRTVGGNGKGETSCIFPVIANHSRVAYEFVAASYVWGEGGQVGVYVPSIPEIVSSDGSVENKHCIPRVGDEKTVVLREELTEACRWEGFTILWEGEICGNLVVTSTVDWSFEHEGHVICRGWVGAAWAPQLSRGEEVDDGFESGGGTIGESCVYVDSL